MLEPQTTELPDQTEHFLDGAVEASELDMGSRMVLIVYGDRERINGIVEGQHVLPAEDGVVYMDCAQGRRRIIERQQKGEALMAYASELLADLDPLHRAGAALLGTAGLRTVLDGLAKCFAGWAIEDSCEGGALEPFSRAKLTFYQHEKRDRAPSKKAGRRLHAPKWVRRYVDHHAKEGPAGMRQLWNVIKARPSETGVDPDAAWTVFDEDYARMRDRLRQRERVMMARIMTEGAITPRPRKITYKEKAALRQKRKVAVRSAIFAAGLLGVETVSAFASGRTVHLTGQEAVLQIAKRGSIYAGGHSALEIALLDTKREKLADLCLYVENTPAFDQLAALALAMEAGEERELIATANLTKIAPAGVDHPLLKGRMDIRHARVIGLDQHRFGNDNARQIRNATYWDETKELWIETLGTYIFNRNWKHIKGIGRKEQRIHYA